MSENETVRKPNCPKSKCSKVVLDILAFWTFWLFGHPVSDILVSDILDWDVTYGFGHF
jgi:hypothetical protein